MRCADIRFRGKSQRIQRAGEGADMLIRVAVIEDETGLHGYYGKMMEAWGTARNVRIAATFVGSAEEYLFKYDGQNIFDIIFLDIC
ncbi:MAG: hypothetical protein K2P89_13790, partial [Lachnospiraceae bacterium]|nr:hypothetical protein [Lachnospiraceae bacterium]